MDRQPVQLAFSGGPNCSPDPCGAGTQAPLDIYRFIQNSWNERTLGGWWLPQEGRCEGAFPFISQPLLTSQEILGVARGQGKM